MEITVKISEEEVKARVLDIVSLKIADAVYNEIGPDLFMGDDAPKAEPHIRTASPRTKTFGEELAERLASMEKAKAAPCPYCDDNPFRLDWEIGLDHLIPGYKYCPSCGRYLGG